MRRLGVLSLWLALASATMAAGQFGVLGRGLARGTVQGPCDVVGGCVAAYSAQRRMVAGYNGSIFQLQKTGGTTQDIGLTSGGTVDMTAIASFCGTTSGSGRSTTTTNSCKVTLIYDQSGNNNTLTSYTSVGCPSGFCTPCPAPYAVNAAGKPIFVNDSNQTCFYGGPNPPINTPTGNANASIYVVANDQIWSTEDNPYAYGLNFGMFHDFVVSDVVGYNYALNLRGGYSASLTSTPFCSFGLDLEQDSAELYYGLCDYTAAERALSPNVHSFGSVGDFAGASSYNASSTNIVIDFQNGLRTYTHTYASMNMGGTQTAEIRQGYTGDGTASLSGAWYEGAIYASALTTLQLQSVEANGISFYNIAAPAVCANGGVDLLGGRSVVTGAWGLRQLDPALPGPVAIIDRVSDNALMVLGTTPGNCNLNTSAASTFCNATTCHIWTLYNQIISVTGYIGGWTGRAEDYSRMTSGGSFTSGPTYTPSGVNSLPTMTFASSSTLTSTGTVTQAVTRPWSLLAAVSRTSGSNWFADGSGTNTLGGTGTSNLQVKSGSGTFTAASTDGTWHAVAGMVPTTTSLRACVNASCTTSGAVSTSDTSSSSWVMGSGSFVGSTTEIFLVNGTDVGSTAAGNLSTVQRSVYGF